MKINEKKRKPKRECTVIYQLINRAGPFCREYSTYLLNMLSGNTHVLESAWAFNHSSKINDFNVKCKKFSKNERN